MGLKSSQSRGPGLNKSDGHLVEYFRQTFGAGGGGTNFVPQVNGHSASGGIINDYTAGNKIYRAHIFTSTDTFTVTELGDFPGVEYLLVAGGGGTAQSPQGGNREAGSGGGGFLTGEATVAANTPYAIVVGAGGAGGFPQQSNPGNTTTAFGKTAYGGGGGGHSDPVPYGEGKNGGSGGGGHVSARGYGLNPNTPAPIIAAFPEYEPGTTQGYNGSPGFGQPEYGGGGGGAGGAGGRGNVGGAGAPNVYAYGPTNPVTYAAGGGSSNYPGTDRTADGAYSTGNGGSGKGSGGSGIAVIRYQLGQTQSPGQSPKGATGGAITIYNGQVIHTFTGSGTFSVPGPFSETCTYLVVGGGGAGNGGTGPGCGGGGGAGGLITGTTPITNPVAIQVGAGAASGNRERVNGTPSYFGTPLTAFGGGGAGVHVNGGPHPDENGNPGGSGGGACDGQAPTGGGNGTSGQGQPGGAGKGNGGSNSVSGGGGGGKGQTGGAAVDQGRGGHGGYGMQLPSVFQDPKCTIGTSPDPNKYSGPNSGNFWVAGGGGGGASATPHGAHALAGQGGGGMGYQSAGLNPLPGPVYVMYGTENTGGGGGGFHGPTQGGLYPGGVTAGKGGSGVVLVAYPET